MYPILLTLGPIKIYSFGVFLVLALTLGAFVVWREGRRLRFDEEKLLDLVLVEAIFGLVGARAYYLIFHFPEFKDLHLFYWLLIFHFPGLSFLGAITGGVIGALVFAKKTNWSFWQIGDFSSLGISLAETIGRIGAFLSGSAYGAPTNLPWGVPMVGLPLRRHPVQIYEALGSLLIFLILTRAKVLIEGKKLQAGSLFLFYLLLFGISKFFFEFFRGDTMYFKDLPTTQIISLTFVAGALILLLWRGRVNFIVMIQRIKRLGVNFRIKNDTV